MKASLFVPLFALVLVAPSPESVPAQDRAAAVQVHYTNEELDNLLAPVALYPDAILAQVLVAATYSDQVQLAAQYVRANGTRGIDDQSWDVSVKAVAHYPSLLNMLAEREDWTVALGQAYAVQSSDVMDAVQRLRTMAQSQGNLASTPQQSVVVQNQQIVIAPAQPNVIYIPTYDPAIVYYQPVRVYSPYAAYWSWGVAYPIGAWLIYDCDWYGRVVYYDGWRGGGWRTRARPFIQISFVYVQPRYQVVHVNRTIVYRTVNYVNLSRYNTVHRNVTFVDRDRGDHRPGGYTSPRPGDRRDDPRYTAPRTDTRPTDSRPTYSGTMPHKTSPPQPTDPRTSTRTSARPTDPRSAPRPTEPRTDPRTAQPPFGGPIDNRAAPPQSARRIGSPVIVPSGVDRRPPQASAPPPINGARQFPGVGVGQAIKGPRVGSAPPGNPPANPPANPPGNPPGKGKGRGR
jgi:hypothetical protein